jgi:hydrogenase-4 component B
MSLLLILAAGGLTGMSGIPGLACSWRSPWGTWLGTLLAWVGALLGLAGVGIILYSGSVEGMSVPWSLPGAALDFRVDPLGAFFLAPVFLMSALGSFYGLGYWNPSKHPRTVARLRLFWGLLVAGMVAVVLAGNGILFLVGWETMALSAFFLIGTEDQEPEVRRASWIYLVATHVGTLCLLALFALLRSASGTFQLRPLGAEEAGLGLVTSIFLLALLGFGLKAGLMPLHVWLPDAHAAAPTHVSAMLSGVVIKMGIYGLVRVTGLLPHPPASWGGLLLLLGALSGILGVVFALGQHDLKRLLAYHSVENIGIIVMGLGLAMLGRSLGRPEWVLLGLAGCLLHVWNHGLFKSLLFMGAGAVLLSMRTREMDRMGGLSKSMPWTAFLFLVGAVAICGLPPLNGFVSELLIYAGLFKSAGAGGSAALPVAAAAALSLALIGALALACFVKAYGAVFLGAPRTPRAARARECPLSMTSAMGILALACATIGLAPFLVARPLERAVGAWVSYGRGGMATSDLESLVSLHWIGPLGVALLGATAILALAIRPSIRRAPRAGTWDCGYARPTPRMQYSSSSFAQRLVGLFGGVLRTRVHRPAVTGPFPGPTRFETHQDDTVLDGLLLPGLQAARNLLGRLRVLQQGRTQRYVLYILVTVLALLVWILPIERTLMRLLSR